jgi:hypothetical protein
VLDSIDRGQWSSAKMLAIVRREKGGCTRRRRDGMVEREGQHMWFGLSRFTSLEYWKFGKTGKNMRNRFTFNCLILIIFLGEKTISALTWVGSPIGSLILIESRQLHCIVDQLGGLSYPYFQILSQPFWSVDPSCS